MPTIDEIADELREVSLQVHTAQERKEERDLVIAAREGVERLSKRYREMYDALSPGEQMKVDRTLGRRVVDVKRLASLLPKVASVAVDSTPDRVAGTSAVGERRITGVSWSHGRAAPTAGKAVGADIEAWCGKCGEKTEHHIVALVGDQPKQVLCTVCNSRHAFRTLPARTKSGGDGAGTSTPDDRPRTPQSVESAKKAEQLRVLAQEVNAAAEIKRFDPKQRYKVGDIISHPEFGRGKIENVLRSSLLVRFPVGGLKSLMLS